MDMNKIIKIQMKLDEENLSSKEKNKLLIKLYKEQKKDTSFHLLITATFLSPLLLLLL